MFEKISQRLAFKSPLRKGPSIKDVFPEGEGGGYPKKETLGDGGRDLLWSKGDVFYFTFEFRQNVSRDKLRE